MGQKVNPNGLRIGITKNWSSRWYADKKDFAKYLEVDMKIRNYLEPKLKDALLSHIDIERIKKTISVSVFVARPGIVIGQNGENIDNIKKGLVKLLGVNEDEVKISVVEIKNPDLDATLVAKSIAKLECCISLPRSITTNFTLLPCEINFLIFFSLTS